MDSHARQFAKLAQVPARHETAIQQSVLQVLGETAGIHAVRLPASQGANGRRIHQYQIEPRAFMHVHTGIQYTPVDSMTTSLTPCCLSHLGSGRRFWVKVPNTASSHSISELPFTRRRMQAVTDSHAHPDLRNGGKVTA